MMFLCLEDLVRACILDQKVWQTGMGIGQCKPASVHDDQTGSFLALGIVSFAARTEGPRGACVRLSE